MANITLDNRPYVPRLIDELLDELLEQLPALMMVGPRAAGKTTTMLRRAQTVVSLDQEAQAAAFVADPDAALRNLEEPVLLDEWQAVPGVLGAVRRAIDRDSRPCRYFLTGSALAEHEHDIYPGTGRIQRLAMYPMTVREQLGAPLRRSIFERLADGEDLAVPVSPPDLRGYVDLALGSGFPAPALRLSGRARQVWLDGYVDDLLTHDVDQLQRDSGSGRRRDAERLRRYFEAFALNSAGLTEHKRIYDAAGLRKETGKAYEDLLRSLLVIEQVPAWSSNRLQRLTGQPKRYVIDPALMAAVLRVDEDGVMADGSLLGRVLDTFVAAQLRPELTVSRTRPRLHHLRTKAGRQEIDLLAELAGRGLIVVEIKAGAAPRKADARHLAWLRDEVGDRFLAGLVLHTGPQAYALGDRIVAAPIASLWT